MKFRASWELAEYTFEASNWEDAQSAADTWLINGYDDQPQKRHAMDVWFSYQLEHMDCEDPRVESRSFRVLVDDALNHQPNCIPPRTPDESVEHEWENEIPLSEGMRTYYERHCIKCDLIEQECRDDAQEIPRHEFWWHYDYEEADTPMNNDGQKKRWQIENTISGMVLGIYEGTNEQDALDTMARDAGHASHAEACRMFPVADGELSVTLVRNEE